jgi:hypothetical protein
MAAVRPAQPVPMITTFSMFVRRPYPESRPRPNRNSTGACMGIGYS